MTPVEGRDGGLEPNWKGASKAFASDPKDELSRPARTKRSMESMLGAVKKSFGCEKVVIHHKKSGA